MTTYVLSKVICCIISAVLAAAVIGRDPRLKINWIIGGIPGCAMYWALCEAVWNTQSDRDLVETMMRLSSLGWIMLGPLCFHAVVEMLRTRGNTRLDRFVLWFYGYAFAAFAVYLASDFGIERAIPAHWGWEPVLGKYFLGMYTATSLPTILATLNFPRIYPSQGSRGERRVALTVFGSVTLALTLASTNEVVLPLMGYVIPRHGSLSIMAVSAMVAWMLRRYGHSLVSPGASAQETLHTLRDGVALLHGDGTIQVANRALERLVGVSEGELLESSFVDLVPIVGEGMRSTASRFEAELCTAAGGTIPVAVSLYNLSDQPVSEVARTGRAVVVSDIRELAGLRDRLLNSARLAAVGELSAGISFEMNRPMGAVRATLMSLRRSWSDLTAHLDADTCDAQLLEVSREGNELIDESLEGVDRVAAILRDVGGFAQSQSRTRKSTQANDVVASALRLVSPQCPAGVEIEVAYGELPPIVCSSMELEQVFVNLLVNAIHAIGESGQIRIATERTEEGIAIHIRDNGTGLSPELADRIFDPFFTTKPVGEGTGLGLAICLRMVRGHGGDIRFTTEPGAGTSFTVELPLTL